jgi:hypothetical protein
MGPIRQPTGHRGGAEGDPIQLPSRHPLWLTGLGKEDREETWPRINPSATREAEENLKMDPSPFLLLWDQRNRLVAFDTWGAQEWVQLPFESDTGAEVIDAIGNAPNGAMFGDAQLVGESSPQEG